MDVFEKSRPCNGEDHFTIELGYCPMVKQWQQMGLSDEMIDLLCDIAMEGDRGEAETLGYECPLKDLLVDITRERFGEVVAIPEILAGGTDAKNMYNLSDHVFRFISFFNRGGPGGPHAVNETMGIRDLAEGPEFYVMLLSRYADI